MRDSVYVALFGSPDEPASEGNEAIPSEESVALAVQEPAPLAVMPPATLTAPPSIEPAVVAPEALSKDIATSEELPEMIMHAVEAAPEEGTAHAPTSLFSESGEDAFQDFFLFIKDYGWSLRYRVQQLTGSLDQEKPLKPEWVKLKKPVHNPTELLNATGDELFDWAHTEPPSHKGFLYHVTAVVGSGVEAVINFFEGYGIKLLIRPDSGIQLTGRPEKNSKGDEDEEPRSITHCWVQVMGMPWLPIMQSIAFFNSDTVVMDWKA